MFLNLFRKQIIRGLRNRRVPLLLKDSIKTYQISTKIRIFGTSVVVSPRFLKNLRNFQEFSQIFLRINIRFSISNYRKILYKFFLQIYPADL